MSYKPDFLFETSWEVCNKVGGIHTVITSKLPELYKELGDNIAFIGPDLVKEDKEHPEFKEDKDLYSDWLKQANCMGVRVRVGRWQTIHNPVAILVDFSPLIQQKDQIFGKLWEIGRVDSLSGSWDYAEAALFGYAVGMVIESFTAYYYAGKNVVAQFHEWMTAAGVLYLENKAPYIGTVFTTHATVLGRSLAGNGYPLYNMLGTFNPDQKAKELNVSSKHSLEKAGADIADSFTTVSEVTAKECNYLLNTEPDFITPNGFSLDHIAPITDEIRAKARETLCKVTKALTNTDCDENTVFMAISGRYEFKNKGIDIFIDTLNKINQRADQKQNVIGFILVPTLNYGPRKDLLDNINNGKFKSLEEPVYTHTLNKNNFDPIIDKCKKLNLLNYQGQKAKLIFVPVYLNGDDGIFNMHYYNLLSGFDLTAFPSYYEPWGYTPLESVAVGVPTFTTTLAGFGQWMKGMTSGILDGLEVLERKENNYNEVVDKLIEAIDQICKASKDDKALIRKRATELAKETVWDKFKTHYLNAYDKSIIISLTKEKTANTNLSARTMDTKHQTNEPNWRKMKINSNLPERLKALEELSMNLWWCWNYEAIELFEEISPSLWLKREKNPISLLNIVTSTRLEELAKDKKYLERLDKVYKKFSDYMNEPARTDMPNIAYFSMEYGLTDNLKIFSGGLGILAGDYIKEASDCNIPMNAFGFLYKYGYFTQELTISGAQQANLVAQKFSSLPLNPVYDEIRRPLTIELNLPGRIVKAKVWRVDVGRVKLYLLDTDHGDNSPEDKAITHQLYGGDWENRLKQEMFLGLGGIRAINKMGLKPDIYHCNEGHAALINVERLTDLVQHENLTYDEALEVVKGSSLFTTHTPVPAGHDAFTEDLIRTYLRHVPERLKVDWNTFLNLGRGNKDNPEEKFSMSVLAARTSQEMNGVSKLHGDVSKDMFQYLWKGYTPDELHIDYVTNGVHYYTWTAKVWQQLYEKEFGNGFLQDMSNKKYWTKIFDVADSKIWEIRNELRANLIDYIKDRFEETYIRRHESPKLIVDIQNTINPKTLTIGFARRFATYKRAHLIFSDIERLKKIVNNPERPVQFLFAGKAHPADGAGQDLIKHIVEISRQPEFAGKIIFLENYDMELAKRLVRGVDVWLNNPTRPLEASGTSGQKAEMNGVLNFSVLDGWWVEGYREKAGWALSEKRAYHNQDFQNQLDAATIYSILENEIVPLYYDRNKDGVPVEWVQYIKRSIADIAPDYTTKRMLDDYISKFYLKLKERNTLVTGNNYKNAIELTNWKANFINNWDNIEVVSVDFPNTLKTPYKTGENYRGEVTLDLKGLDENEVGIEMVFTIAGRNRTIDCKPLKVTKKVDSLVFYEVIFELNKPGSYDFGLRIYPKNDLLPHRQDFPILRWI